MIACLAKGNLLDVLQEGFTEQQLQSYVVWVNSQLKKKPGLNPVQDLRQDLRDGVALTQLVEIVAGEQLSDICFNPSSHQEMKDNVEKVLQFVASKKIRMHQTSARDIVEGNLKCTMRLILALAAHFKPSGVRSASQRSAVAMGSKCAITLDNHKPLSAMVQSAAAALAEVRQDVSRSGREVFRYKQEVPSFEEEIGSPSWSVRAMVQQFEGQQLPLSPPLSPSCFHKVFSTGRKRRVVTEVTETADSMKRNSHV
uniref:dixin isoform X7 n=1 Tax=Pristiophorus japonicus TaxID=55135 RepID=UPI00398E585A